MIAFPASLLILNGKSADNLPLRDAIAQLRNESVEIHVRVTWEKGDAQRYVDEALRLGVATVIAGGGDGTINEVSTALIHCQGENVPALGILPLGTANDFATSVGIPEALDKALKLAIAGNAVEIDMAQVNDKTCFINMATGGFGTRITSETPDFHWQGDALVIGIGNGRQAGGGQQLCPTALINDGLLQLRIFTGEELIPALLSAITQSEDNPNIIDGTSSWFDIRAPHEITFNLDGEPLSGQEFHVEILPAALRCRLPPGCPLLR